MLPPTQFSTKMPESPEGERCYGKESQYASISLPQYCSLGLWYFFLQVLVLSWKLGKALQFGWHLRRLKTARLLCKNSLGQKQGLS